MASAIVRHGTRLSAVALPLCLSTRGDHFHGECEEDVDGCSTCSSHDTAGSVTGVSCKGASNRALQQRKPEVEGEVLH